MKKRYHSFITVNMSQPRTRQTFVLLCLAVAFTFALAGALAMGQAKSRLASAEFSRITSHISSKTLLMAMSENIPYLQEKMQEAGMEEIASRMALELATSIDLRDPRTYLGKELPMYDLFDSEIDVASSDFDYTSIPIESPPPPELEQEIIKAMEDPDEDVNERPTGSIKNKQVLIYNTHFWESYLPELGKKDPRLASDVRKNITTVSKHMANQLERMGVGAVTVNRKYTWNSGAYVQSRKMVKEAMAQHEDVTYLIDLHRDAQRRPKTTKVVNGKAYARLAFVVGRESKNYEENLRLARELYKRLNEVVPGICSTVIIKKREKGNNGEYNQSLSPNSLLVEVGGVDNTFEEANRSVEVLARVIAERIGKAKPVSNGR
ncbi:stage II sporulation protein P [Laceyella sacchari]|uniref:stage II sporulation protein P n=1 Tax=Laceyella sacchari TaxID=37482 RepID=UPI00104CB332|nr:stage II sporulation protein P [Laceyella sacchari]TCW37709.1 stage II sporulation protein P [Laceyella sacchari]